MSKKKAPLTLPKTGKGDVLEAIRKIANESTIDIIFLDHAILRQNQREISDRQVLTILKRGELASDVTWDTEQESGWKCKLRGSTAGASVSVVAKLVDRDNTKCLVVTVWS